jgi:hypothetical protein
LAINYYFSGLTTFGYHLLNFGVFLLQLVVMFFCFTEIIQRTDNRLDDNTVGFWALFATFLYGYNTVLCETLNYIVSRSDSFSTFFVTIGVYLFIARGPKSYYYLVPFILALFSKETGIVFPALLFSYQFLFSLKSSFVARLKEAFFSIIPAIIVAVLYLGIYFSFGADPIMNKVSRLSYFVTQIYVTAHYFLMFFLPVNLSADSDATIFVNFFDEKILMGGAIHLFLIGSAFFGVFKKNLAPVTFGILWFYISLLPTSSIIPIDDVQNDHRMFFPFVGIALAVSWLLLLLYLKLVENGYRRFANTAAIVFSVIYLSGHAYGLSVRHEVWSSKENLWRDVTLKSPENPRGLMNYGIALMERGDYVGARELYNKALKYWPAYSYLHINLGVVNGAENKDEEAEKEFLLATKLEPSNPAAHFFYANWLVKKMRYEDALKAADKVLAVSPQYFGAKELRGTILLKIEEAKKGL